MRKKMLLGAKWTKYGNGIVALDDIQHVATYTRIGIFTKLSMD
jgi:hypothetical protein